MQNGTLKRETESLIFASQEQAIRTNPIKGKTDKSQEQTKCRMCSGADGKINHIASECPKISQKEYKKRHDWIGKHIHWEICVANGIHVKPKWHEYQPETVIENDSWKILWDFTTQTDHFITARRPDMIFIDKEYNECQIYDFAILCDRKVDDKEVEKIETYFGLGRELKKVWNKKMTVVPLVVGALGRPTKTLEIRLNTTGIEKRITKLQKTVLRHISRILQKILEV